MNEEELQRRHRQFLEWSSQFGPLLMKLHLIGFKGYIIKNDSTVEEVMHEHVQKEIDSIHSYIESKAKELGLTTELNK